MLFTLASAGERARFLDALQALRAERRCAVIFTLRADFFGALMESTLWAERRGQLSRVEVSPLRGESLREAIAAPARAVDVTMEPALVERLVADAASEPGILPLLQETLVQLWDARIDQTLTLADYEALGDGERSGLAVALARRADATLRRFNAAQTDIARRILLRLISFGEGRSDTRRQQPRAQLRATGEDAGDFAFVLQTMVDDRLLTVDEGIAGEPRVDLAHEITISRMAQGRRRRRELVAATTGRKIVILAVVVACTANFARNRASEEHGLAVTNRSLAENNRELVAPSYAEAGRPLVLDHRDQEVVPYLLAARQSGECRAPLRMMLWEARRHLPLTPLLEHQAGVVSAAFGSELRAGATSPTVTPGPADPPK